MRSLPWMISPITEQKPSQTKRFKTLTGVEVEKLKKQNTEETTNHQTKWAVRLLKDWMKEDGRTNTDFEYLELPMLDNLLQKFYACLQTKDGNEYSKSALVSIRAGLNRYLTSPPFSLRISLMKDKEFIWSNQVLSGLIKGLKRQGKDLSKHKEPICSEDIAKLYQSNASSLCNAQSLQNKVLFEIISQFGRRGREGLRYLKRNSFEIKKDAKGCRYVCMTFNEADKTHHGLDSRETSKQPRMYETGGPYCPMRSFEKYLSKLHPECDAFFQRPLTNVKEEMPIWYYKRAVGHNALSSFMPKLSEECALSQRYTNHCIRAYVSSHPHGMGFSPSSIMSVTGHRNASSLSSYIKPSDEERRNLSVALMNNGETHSSGSSECVTTSLAMTTSTLNTTTSSRIETLQLLGGNVSGCNITVNIRKE